MSRRTLHDRYFRQAKAEGYAARSAYKLKELNERRRVLPKGGRVLDLGCAPGAWLQVAAEAVGERGRVVGLDLKPVRIELPPSVVTLVGDAFETDPATLIEAGGGRFDCVLSDMAPDTSGAGDHFRSVRLCRRVLEILPGLLAPGGSLAMKVFEGEEYPALLRETGALFGEARGLKPKATRDVSREMYIIATGYAGGDGDEGRRGTRDRHAVAPAPPRPGKGWGDRR